MIPTSARELGLCRCHTCGLLVRYQNAMSCPRKGERDRRAPRANRAIRP